MSIIRLVMVWLSGVFGVMLLKLIVVRVMIV